MNPYKKDYNGWILCPSTRFLGKFYFFNPATGQAVWNLSDMERIMTSRPNFTNSEKWYEYPEPDSPPEDAPNPWGYQPDLRSYQQPMPPFGQPSYPNFPANGPNISPHGMWGMPHPMPMGAGMMSMPWFGPMAQMWASYGHSANQFMPNNYCYPHPYMPKMPAYNRELNRHVFGPKPNLNIPVFPVNNNSKEMIKKRRMSMESVNLKEPLFKRLRSQTEFQNGNLLGVKDNMFPARSFESFVPEKDGKPCKTSVLQEKNSNENVCKCKLSKSHENLSRMFSKSDEDLSNIARYGLIKSNKKEPVFPNVRLSRSKSVENLSEIASEISSNFSLKNSFIFPLRKSVRTKSIDCTDASESGSKKNVTCSGVAQSGQENKKTGENSDNNLSESDLRHILLQRKKNSSLSDLQETEKEKAKKIKTSYSEDHKLRESSFKKRVTFHLGVEDSVIDDQDEDNPHEVEACADATEPYADELMQTAYLIADSEALMNTFELLEEFVKSEPTYVLLIADCVRREVEAVSGKSASEVGPRRRVTAARNIARRVAQAPAHIQVHSFAPTSAEECTGEPLLDCCLQVYEEGYTPVLISDNEELLLKASAMEIEYYQTADIVEYISKQKTEVSFNLKKTNNESPISDVPVNVSRTQLFQHKDNTNQFFLNKSTDKSDTQNSNKHDNEQNNNFFENITLLNQKSFFDKDFDLLKETTQINQKIKNMKLQDNVVDNMKLQDNVVDNQRTLAGKGKENSNLLKKNEAMEDNVSDKKKIKNVNVYNLDGLLKGFSIKSKEMEEAIRTKMDEYFCCFSQIMETIFMDVSKDMQVSGCESSLTPLQSSLHYMREIFADNRTASLLSNKLAAMLDKAHTLINGRLVLSVEPQDFLTMFGCGTLLVNVMRSIDPSDGSLQDGERALCALEALMERGPEGGESPAPTPPAPHTPHTATEHRHEYVKDPAEVLHFLTKHFPDWQHSQRAHNSTAPHNNSTAAHNNYIDVNSNVVRTTGRDVGLLKLNPGKPLILSNKDERSSDDYKETNKDEDKERKDKAKIIRKLAIESTNLPPKMKEIDVERREQIDRQCAEMLEQMVTGSVPRRPVTRFYNLRSVIVNNEGDDKKHVTRNVTNLSSVKDYQSNNKIDSTTKTIEEKNVNINDTKEIDSNDRKELAIAREPLNLDAFDYSEESVHMSEHDDSMDGSSNKNVVVESDNSNYVTTTQRSNDGSNEISEKVNETGDKTKDTMDGVDHSNDVENYDSGVESEQASCFVQHFLTELSATFLTIKQFIESSAKELQSKADAGSKQRIHRKAEHARGLVARIINNLDFISDRESNPETSVTPLLGGASQSDSDVPITKYRLVISQCSVSAHVLHDALTMLVKLTHGHTPSHTLPSVSRGCQV